MSTVEKANTIRDNDGDFLLANTNTEPVIVRGEGAEVEDDQGRRYLDLEGGPGVVSVGHCHPRVVKAIRDQAGTLTQSPGRYHSHLASSLARRLADLFDGRLRRVFFANSGAEANDGAIKVALKHAIRSGKQGFGIFALEHAFHGRLSLPLSLTGMAGRKKGFGPYATFPGVVHMPAPYCYRCPLGLTYPTCQVKCADTFEEALKTKVPGEVAILIAEPILAVGGVIVPPPEYWPKVQAFCDQHQVTLIQDEVFAGFGRTGKMFGHQHWDLKPAIVTFAKTIGGGVPLGGFITTEAVGRSLEGGDHFTTFGSNNQVGLAAGHAVLDVLQDEKLPERAAQAGRALIEGLEQLARRYEPIGEVRGKGLMIGVELVRNRASRAPAPELAKQIQQDLRAQGVLICPTGVHNCVLRITPPLVITDAQIARALAALETALSRATGGKPTIAALPGGA